MYLVYRGSLEEKEYVPKLEGLGSPVVIAGFSTRALAVEYALARSFATVVLERNVSIQGGDSNNLFSECEYDKSVTPPPPPPPPPVIGGSVTIDDTNIQAGDTLTVDISQLTGSGIIHYQWLRADTASDTPIEIANAVNSTYVLDAADANKYISVRITMTEPGLPVVDYTGEVIAPLVGPIMP